MKIDSGLERGAMPLQSIQCQSHGFNDYGFVVPGTPVGTSTTGCSVQLIGNGHVAAEGEYHANTIHINSFDFNVTGCTGQCRREEMVLPV